MHTRVQLQMADFVVSVTSESSSSACC